MKTKKQNSAFVLTGYQNKFVIERRTWPAGTTNWRTVEKIELNKDETDDLLAFLPQAILQRERAIKTKQPKSDECFSAELL